MIITVKLYYSSTYSFFSSIIHNIQLIKASAGKTLHFKVFITKCFYKKVSKNISKVLLKFKLYCKVQQASIDDTLKSSFKMGLYKLIKRPNNTFHVTRLNRLNSQIIFSHILSECFRRNSR